LINMKRERKMDRAINKSTQQIVSAFEIHNNGSYQNLNKGEWISPKDSIYNWNELENKEEPVHYVSFKEYTNYNGTEIVCSPHFAVYPGSLAKTVEESKEHKILKDWLFNRLKNDDLEIRYSKGTKPHKYDNKLKLSELNINWNDYEIEVTTKGTKRLRADILLPFKKKDTFLGNGIIFEIQLSSQNEEQTYERTIERALHGYSVVWLFEKDFIIEEDNIKLKENIVNVNSFSEQMHFAKKSFVKKLKFVVENQCRLLDEKIKETNFEMDKLIKQTNIEREKLDNKKEEIYNEISKRLDLRETILFQKIESLEGNPFKGFVENYKQQIQECFNNLEFNLNNSFKEKMKELNYPLTLGECNKCHQGYMHYKKTRTGKEVYSCSNYPNCKNTVWLNNVN